MIYLSNILEKIHIDKVTMRNEVDRSQSIPSVRQLVSYKVRRGIVPFSSVEIDSTYSQGRIVCMVDFNPLSNNPARDSSTFTPLYIYMYLLPLGPRVFTFIPPRHFN
jgi:hypothetical protein